MTDAVLTVEQMRAAEQAAMDGGISEWGLMQRAGRGAAKWVARMAAGRSVTVLCGPGNNGGDGYVIAEEIRSNGNPVRVIAPSAPSSETARTARDLYRGEVDEQAPLEGDVVVDCLFGYGLSRDVEGKFAKLLEEVGGSACFKIAIDVPSAVESDSGAVLGPLPNYDLTLALGAWKHAHFLMPARASMGALRFVEIGIEIPTSATAISKKPTLAAPPADAHKYRRGVLTVVAGEMPGAPLLSAMAAMHSGAGYVKLASEHSHPDAPADLVIDADALEDERVSAGLIGPGLGRGEAARASMNMSMKRLIPLVCDADALHLLDPALLERGKPANILVTPHEGELAALCKAFDVTADSKLAKAQALHDATGLTVLAKGPDTILVGAQGTRFFARGSSWLSVAGSGDVLAGVAASRLATHGDPFCAAEEAVWLHHEAARIAGPAFSAEDLARAVRPAMARFL